MRRICSLIVIVWLGCGPVLAGDPVCVEQFRGRVRKIAENLPGIAAAAEAAAARVAGHPQALITVPYGDQAVFAEEMLNRAGGLANALPVEERAKLATAEDVMLMSARSWAGDAERVRRQVSKAKENGWLVVFFGSAAGKPADVAVDYLLDNFAATGGEDEASVNALGNVLNGWLWTCEYYAALTRRGKYPGVLYSVLMEGSTEHNAALQKGDRRFLGEAATPIAAGELSKAYLARLDALLLTMTGAERLGQIEKAAGVIAADLGGGRTVGVSSCTHFLLNELALNRRTAIKPFHVVWRAKQAFAKNLAAGDLVIWFGYVGMSTPYEDYFGAIRAAGLRVVASYVPDKEHPSNEAAEALAFIAQDWTPPDAEVVVPYPPGRIAPVSGINQGLLMLMLEERVLAVMQAGSGGS